MKFLSALRFLTIIPLPGLPEVSSEEVGRSQVYFPVVGLIIGLLLAGLAWLLTLVLPITIVAILLIIALVLIIGGLHLDGLADTFDGLAGHNIEERWRIMRDSHIGSFGVIAIFCLLLLEYGSLINIPRPWLLWSLILMPTAGRWAMVYSIRFYPYARPSGLGKVFKDYGVTEKEGVVWFSLNDAPLKGGQKLFSTARGGWLAHVYQGLLFVKQFEDISPRQLAPQQGEIEIYANEDKAYIELENHGIYRLLRPGESLHYSVTWHLLKLPDDIRAETGNSRLIETVQKTILYTLT